MTAVAERVSDRRAEFARWAICSVVVVAAHGLGAMALMANATEESDIGVDTPVVVVDLANSPFTQMAPPVDAAPGPLEEEESNPTPPKQETKPLEPEAEVSIPIPEQPKVELPSEEKHIHAPQRAIAPQAVVKRWQSRLFAHLSRFKHYPDRAISRDNEGIATIEFMLDHEGHLLSSRIIQSAGSAMLDHEARAMITRALPLPRPPDNISDAELTINFKIDFNLK